MVVGAGPALSPGFENTRLNQLSNPAVDRGAALPGLIHDLACGEAPMDPEKGLNGVGCCGFFGAGGFRYLLSPAISGTCTRKQLAQAG